MTKPYQRWPQLWEFFVLLNEDWSDDFESEDDVMLADLPGWPSESLTEALREWHDAFDTATDEQVSVIVDDFNPSYDAHPRFGSARGWAEWVREHLEGELARRSTRRL